MCGFSDTATGFDKSDKQEILIKIYDSLINRKIAQHKSVALFLGLT